MGRLRDLLNNNPIIGWLVACVLGIAVFVLLVTRLQDNGPYSMQRMTETVTIRCTETGETWSLPRGRMEVQLRMRRGVIDPQIGLENPNTGQLTGFPLDESWQETITRLNAEKELASQGPLTQ